MKIDVKRFKDTLSRLEKALSGGAGSGNFGHSGRPGKRGGSGKGFSAGSDVVMTSDYGENIAATVVRKLSDQEKQDRAFLANPNAGDYYEVEYGKDGNRSKSIVWEGKLKEQQKTLLDKAVDKKAEKDSSPQELRKARDNAEKDFIKAIEETRELGYKSPKQDEAYLKFVRASIADNHGDKGSVRKGDNGKGGVFSVAEGGRWKSTKSYETMAQAKACQQGWMYGIKNGDGIGAVVRQNRDGIYDIYKSTNLDSGIHSSATSSKKEYADAWADGYNMVAVRIRERLNQ